jgi:hypothetical protein
LKINNILVENHLTESRRVLVESCQGLDQQQRKIVEGIVKELQPLIEASLTPQQIQGIFGGVEKAATDAGGNRTLLGKGVDVAKKADAIINNIGKWLQDTTPVKAFDQKFEDLKATISKKFPDLSQKVAGMGEWAKANPGKTAAIVGVLTAIASLAGGPVGGAIAGQVLRGSVELLKGEKLSTAIGKGVKTAVFGYLSGKAFEMLGEFAEGIRIKSLPFGPENAGFEQVSFGATKTITAPGMEWTREIQGIDIIVDPEMASAVRSAETLLRMGGDAANEGFEQLENVAKIINSAEYKQEIASALEISRQELIKNDSLLNFIKAAKEGLQAVSQGAVAAAGVAGGKEKKESVYLQSRPLSEGQVYLVFNRIAAEQLNEGPMDMVKGAANWVSKKAGNLTTKITADKLNSAWQKAGSPTDSDQLADFLAKQNIDTEMIKSVYASMKLPAPGSGKALADLETVKQLVAKLPVDRKARLLKYLLGGAKGMKQSAEIAADRERLLPQAAEDIK